MNDVHIIGIGMTRLGKHIQTSVKSLVREAVDRALADAGCEVGAIQAAWFCNTRQGIFEGQHGIRGQVALRPLGLEGIPIFNTDNACASSAAGLHLARSYILSGCAETALVVGAEKMNFPGRERDMYDAFRGSTDVELAAAHRQRVIDAASDFPGPVQDTPAAQSVFMQSYSAPSPTAHEAVRDHPEADCRRRSEKPLELAVQSERAVSSCDGHRGDPC